MSRTDRPESTASGCELAPVTCWPLIISAASLVTLGILIASGLLLFDALRPAAAQVAVTEPQPPAPEQPVPAAALSANPKPLPDLRPPERVVSVKRVVVREYRPMPGRPALVHQAERLPGRAAVVRQEERPAVVRLARKARSLKDAPCPPYDRTEEYLRELLEKGARQIDLETEKGAGKKLLEEGQKHIKAVKVAQNRRDKKEVPSLSSPIEQAVAKRDDLKGLPLLLGKACQTGSEQAKVLGVVSRSVRRLQARARLPVRSRTVLVTHDDPKLADYLRDSLKQHRTQELLVRPFEQMYQTESHPLRVTLVLTLAAIKSKESTQALARRAVFDLSPQVRRAAIEALKSRKAADARPVFLSALQYPWAPAADHAALALVALDDEAVPALRNLLDQPDPAAPYRDKSGKWFRKELVRVNHLRNCLLCHAPSTDLTDPVRAPIPTPGKPLPVVYYGDVSKSRLPSVRADIVYLRQDFSALHGVAEPNKWPEVQRFDYLVRTRELKAEESCDVSPAARKKTYPQREAVRYALSKLDHSLSRVDTTGPGQSRKRQE
jgi:hypothetical protein